MTYDNDAILPHVTIDGQPVTRGQFVANLTEAIDKVGEFIVGSKPEWERTQDAAWLQAGALTVVQFLMEHVVPACSALGIYDQQQVLIDAAVLEVSVPDFVPEDMK